MDKATLIDTIVQHAHFGTQTDYLDAAKKSYTDKGQQPPSDEELLKGINKIQTKDKDGPRKPCGHCGNILGSMGVLDKCDPPAGSSKGK